MLKWFGVRSIYKLRALGKPKKIDKDYNPDVFLFEDRVVLFRAKDFDSAIRKAKKEAKCYVSDTFINVYTQKVITTQIGVFDAFEIFEIPGHGKEVYSMTRLIKRRLTNKQAEDLFFDKKENTRKHRLRKNFSNKSYNAWIK